MSESIWKKEIHLRKPKAEKKVEAGPAPEADQPKKKHRRGREPLPPFPAHLLTDLRAPAARESGTVAVPVVPADGSIQRVERWTTHEPATVRSTFPRASSVEPEAQPLLLPQRTATETEFVVKAPAPAPAWSFAPPSVAQPEPVVEAPAAEADWGFAASAPEPVWSFAPEAAEPVVEAAAPEPVWSFAPQASEPVVEASLSEPVWSFASPEASAHEFEPATDTRLDEPERSAELPFSEPVSSVAPQVTDPERVLEAPPLEPVWRFAPQPTEPVAELHSTMLEPHAADGVSNVAPQATEPVAEALVPEPEPVAAPEPAVEKVPLLKREISLKRKPKAAKPPKAKKAPKAKQTKAEKPAADKTPFLKREISLKRKPKAEQAPEVKRDRHFPKPSVKPGDKGDHRVTRVIGLRIGSTQLAAAHVQNNGSHELVQWARMPLARGLVVGGEVRDAETLTRALKEFFAANKLPRKDVRLGIASSRIGVRVLDVPAVDDPKAFENAIRFRAQELLPIPVTDAILDHVVLGDVQGEDGEVKRRVLLVFAHRELVTRFVDVCRGAGVRLVGIDLDAFALLRAVGEGGDGSRAVVAVAVGHDRTVLAVSDGKTCDFTRVLEWGGSTIDVAVARSLNLTPSQAEPIKQMLDLDATDAPEGLAPVQFEAAKSAVRTEIGALGRELVSSLRFYQSRPDSLALGEVLLAGGAAQLRGLPEELGRLLGVPVRVADPLAKLTLGKKVKLPVETGSLAIAVGLGIEV